MILVNAIGCKESGSRIIARRLCECYSSSERLLVIVANTTGDYPKNAMISYLALSHPVFGRWLRPVYELILYMLTFFPGVRQVINLSSYGLCPGSRHSVYFQNANLLRENHPGFETGKSNVISRFLLKTCLKNSRKMVVQTSVVKREIQALFGDIIHTSIEVCMPRIELEKHPAPEFRFFEFQGFYPTSQLAYKKNKLACQSFEGLSEGHGLIITVDPENEDNGMEMVRRIGIVSYADLEKYYSSSDYLLFTSEVESLGLPLLEAMSLGLPAVLPNLAYSREIYGEAGIYFDDFSPSSVAAAVEELKVNYDGVSDAVVKRWDELKPLQKSWREHWEVLLAD